MKKRVLLTSLAALCISADVFGQSVQFGVMPESMPQFGVVPRPADQAQANRPGLAGQQTNTKHYYGNYNQRPSYNGYSYQWSRPGYSYPPSSYPYHYGAPIYSGPIGPPSANGGSTPWMTVIPLGGQYGYSAPTYPHHPPTVCSVCHYPPSHCSGPHYPHHQYPAYPSGYYPGGYYPDGYYSRDTRTTNGGISIGNDKVRVNIGGSRTTTESSTNTTIYGR